MSTKIAVVTGANGFVGSFVCRELLKNGYTVRALHRKNSKLDTIKDLSVETLIADVVDKDSLLKAFQGADFVFHIAAIFREAKHPESAYFEVNTQGTQNVLDAAIESSVKKVIHCSTIGVHSSIKNPPADESEPYCPADVYQESKCAGEKLALEYFRSGRIFGAVIRPAVIWGPGDTRFLKLFKGLAHGKIPMIGNGKILTHWIYVTDLARAFRLAAEKDIKSGEIFIIAGKRPAELNEVYSLIAKHYGQKLFPFKIPVWPFQLIGSIVEALCLPFGIEPPIHRRRADFFTKNRAFNVKKAESQLSYIPEHTLEEEVKLIASWYQKNRWI